MDLTERQLFECDKPHCNWRRLIKPEELEHEKVNHRCPNQCGETKVSWSVTKTLVQQVWDKLDAAIEGIHEDKVSPEYHKHRARAFCEVLAIFMVPHFTTADEVGQEAMRRYRAKQEGDLTYETAGLGSRRYETPADARRRPVDATGAGAATQARGRGSRAAAGAPRKAPIRLSEADQMGIKNAHAGMPDIFTVAVLAKQYGTTETEVRAILSS